MRNENYPWLRLRAFSTSELRAMEQQYQLLTSREQQVAHAIAEGMPNGEIAKLLHIRAATVKSHINSILYKLNLQDRAQAAVFMHRRKCFPCPHRKACG